MTFTAISAILSIFIQRANFIVFNKGKYAKKNFNYMNVSGTLINLL